MRFVTEVLRSRLRPEIRSRFFGASFQPLKQVFKTLGNGLYFINGFTFPPREGGSGGAEYGGGQESEEAKWGW